MLEGFFHGVSAGFMILLVLLFFLTLFLWFLVPFLLLRTNGLLKEIRDLLAERTKGGGG